MVKPNYTEFSGEKDDVNYQYGPRQVVVTGAASGIGQAQMEEFLKQGDYVYAIDIQEIDKPKNISTGQLICYQLDLTDVEQIERFVTDFKQVSQTLDVLCNTAGVLDGYANLESTSYDLWHHILATNLSSMFYLTKALLPSILENGGGKVINMASIAGLTAGGGGIAYTSAKHAIIGFTKQLAYDYSSLGLQVNAIAPGAIKTPMNQADFDGDGAMADWVASQVPSRRWAKAREVANLTLYLASDQSSYVQGAVIPIDGGWLIR